MQLIGGGLNQTNALSIIFNPPFEEQDLYYIV
jgi:hypothetical protein